MLARFRRVKPREPRESAAAPLQSSLSGQQDIGRTTDCSPGQHPNRLQSGPSPKTYPFPIASMDHVLTQSNCPYMCGTQGPRTLARRNELYEPLSAEGAFRFVILHPSENIEQPLVCSLFQHALSPAFEYTALSYEWGAPKLSAKTGLRATEFIRLGAPRSSSQNFITVNGIRLEVNPNLFDALLHLRSCMATSIGSVLWVDSLCINQQEVVERGHQVAQMDRIYSQAQQVICWLGLATKDTYSIPYYACADIMQRSYWYRVWIIQEFVLARRVVFLCGERSFSIDEIQNPEYVNDRFRKLRALRERYNAARSNSILSLGEVLSYSARSIATDPRDMIYGVFGLVNQGCLQGFEPDYTLSPCEVFCNVIQLLFPMVAKGSQDEARRIKHYSTFHSDDDQYVGHRKNCNGSKDCSTLSWIGLQGTFQ